MHFAHLSPSLSLGLSVIRPLNQHFFLLFFFSSLHPLSLPHLLPISTSLISSESLLTSLVVRSLIVDALCFPSLRHDSPGAQYNYFSLIKTHSRGQDSRIADTFFFLLWFFFWLHGCVFLFSNCCHFFLFFLCQNY